MLSKKKLNLHPLPDTALIGAFIVIYFINLQTITYWLKCFIIHFIHNFITQVSFKPEPFWLNIPYILSIILGSHMLPLADRCEGKYRNFHWDLNLPSFVEM